jgi:hypothetical protein
LPNIKQPSDLLRVLLRRHYRGQRIPTDLDERFIQLLRQSTLFDDWPLETLVTDREAFFAFLQERWPIFLDHEAAKGASGVREGEKPYGQPLRTCQCHSPPDVGSHRQPVRRVYCTHVHDR